MCVPSWIHQRNTCTAPNRNRSCNDNWPTLSAKSQYSPPSILSEVWKPLSHVQLFATSWTLACQAPLSIEFSRQEYWNGLSFPPPGDLPNPGIKPRSPTLHADSLPCEPPGKPYIKWFLKEKEYVKAVYCHHAYLTYMQSISWEMLGWKSHKLESRLPGENQ